MNEKVFWFDTETTGITPKINSIVQIAGLIEINGKVVEEFNFFARPHEVDVGITIEALDIIGKDINTLREYPETRATYLRLKDLMGKYADPYDRTDKFSIAGKSVVFDISFLKYFFEREEDHFLFALLDPKHILDIGGIINYCRFLGYLPIEDSKLETVANYLGIELTAHEALSDIRVTREIFNILARRLKWQDK